MAANEISNAEWVKSFLLDMLANHAESERLYEDNEAISTIYGGEKLRIVYMISRSLLFGYWDHGDDVDTFFLATLTPGNDMVIHTYKAEYLDMVTEVYKAWKDGSET